MHNTTLEEKIMKYQIPLFKNPDGIMAIEQVRRTDLKDRPTKYKEFCETYKKDLAEFESILSENISNFMEIVDTWATAKDKTKKAEMYSLAMEYVASEPKYFAYHLRDVKGEQKYVFACQTLLYANKKIDE